MNENEKSFLDEIKNENIELPESLKKENIVSKINEQNIKPEKKKPSFKRYIALAASFVIVVAVVAVGAGLLLPDRASNMAIEGKNDYGSAPIKSINNYAEIEKFFLSKQKQYKKENKKSFRLFSSQKSDVNEMANGTDDSAAGGDSSGSSTGQGASSQKEYGSTNTQVKNVDEADVIKNDGRYIYTVSRSNPNKINIVDAEKPNDLKMASTIDVSNEGFSNQVLEFFQKGDTLVAIISSYYMGDTVNGKNISPYGAPEIMTDTCYQIGSGNVKVIASVYDISDRKNPNKTNEITFDGSYISSRLIENKLYLMTNYLVPLFKDDEVLKDSCIPSYYKGEEKVKFPADTVKILDENQDNTYMCVAVIDIADKNKEVKTSAVLGGGTECYSTENKLFLSRQVYDNTKKSNSDDVVISNDMATSSKNSIDNSKTQIFMFDIGEDVKFNCFGEVNGRVLNQFSMDEYNGYFRIATTLDMNASNSVTVLDSKLQKVGEITELAKGERIYSVRFMGDTAYAVTFKQTDPLFIIDLKNPAEPKVLGEVKIPGFSNYLHPYSDKYIIGIGPDGTETGVNGNLKVSLFDVSDKTSPKEVSKATYNGQYVRTEVQNSHKAYLTISGTNEFAIPISKTINGYKSESYLSTLTVENDKLKITGKYGEGEKTQSDFADVIYRGTYIGNTIFTISDKTVSAYDKDAQEKIGSIKLY